jgi:hypothetical protein
MQVAQVVCSLEEEASCLRQMNYQEMHAKIATNIRPPRFVDCRTRRHQISLYAHITGLAFALDTINAPVHKATISDPSGSHELRTVTIDAGGRTPFETANEIWSLL